MSRPIEAWPRRKFKGRAGYSARHFAALAGAANDPLSVAERIASRQVGEAVASELPAKIEALGHSAALDWQTRELTERRASMWAMLCESFELVIAALESEKPTPELKRLVREAKRAAR